MSKQRSQDAATTLLRLIPAAAVIAAPLVISTRATSTMLPKATLVVALAALALSLILYSALRTRALAIPLTAPTVTAGLLLVGLSVAAFVAPVPISAWLGPPTRSAGLAVYLACIALFFTVVLYADEDTARRTVIGGLIAIGVTALVGLGQAAPIDLGVLQAAGRSPIALLGNTNFSSSLLGMGVPLALWGLIREQWSLTVRLSCGVLALTAFGVAWWSGAIQGPIVALAGSSVLAAAVVLERAQRPRRILVAGGAALFVTGAVFLAGLIAQVGPLATFAGRAALGPRLWYWQAAWRMFTDAPATGVGLGMYPGNYTVFRSVESVRDLPEGLTADSAHSVPMSMLAEGGLLLAAAYFAFVLAIGWTLVRGLGATKGETRLLLGATGGTWFGYQVQSLVSIEVPGLMPWHYVFGALIIVLAAHHPVRTIGSNNNARVRRRAVTGNALGPLTLSATIAGALIWLTFFPLRADAAHGRGLALAAAVAEQNAQPQQAVDAFMESTNLLPPYSVYWTNLGVAQGQSGDLDAAFESLEEGVRRNPFDRSAVATAARNESLLGDAEKAERHWRHLLDLDPYRVSYLVEAGEFFLDVDDRQAGQQLFERAIWVDPASERAAEGLARLGDGTDD